MAIDGNELNTAEVAFAAIEEVDKLQFIAHIKEIPTVEGRNSELYLFKGMIKEAESVLLQTGLIFRAIKLNIKLFRWERYFVILLHVL
jgi:intraflagellar transport protein 80